MRGRTLLLGVLVKLVVKFQPKCNQLTGLRVCPTDISIPILYIIVVREVDYGLLLGRVLGYNFPASWLTLLASTLLCWWLSRLLSIAVFNRTTIIP